MPDIYWKRWMERRLRPNEKLYDPEPENHVPRMVPCPCGPYLVDADAQDATYVKDGIPMCHEETCRKVKERRDLHRVPYFDEES